MPLRRFLLAVALSPLVVICVCRAADRPFVHPLFGDDMVLQRDTPDPIWGWTEPGKTVTVTMNGRSATATADADGKWLAKIGPFEAGGPFELTVSGPSEAHFKNVLVGDVWICSGQSNMEFGVANGFDKVHEIAAANDPELRLFTVPHQIAYSPKTSFGPHDAQPKEAEWLVTSPQNILVGNWGGFSAVAYYFGRDLREHLKIPIGLIHTSWGGTVAEAWTGADALKEMPDFRAALANVEKQDGRTPARARNNPNVPTVLYNGMIAPLEPMAVKGAIWYQGEANANRARQYQTLLPTMIRDWRSHFSGGDFPFLIVQLASFMAPDAQPRDSQWAELREAQAMTADRVGHSAIAVATDVGEARDIHPRNKQEVGARLALDALAIAYGEKIEYSGPVYRGMNVDGDSVVLHFTHLGGGLAIQGSNQLHGFAIAGADGKFVNADAKIVGETVVVSSPRVPHPTAVRYAWANNPEEANLTNRAGLPAPPFRTDTPGEEGR